MRILLNKTHNLYGWLVTSLSGLFMFITLYIYRSYHIDQFEAFTGHSILVRSLVHSMIISAVFYLFEFYLAPRLIINQRFKPLVTAALATFLGLNLTFVAFNYFFHWTELYWSSYAKFLYEYPLIIVVPVVISYLIASLVDQHSRDSAWITFFSSNKKEQFQLKLANLLYVKSADNYVEIVHRNKELVQKRMIRKELKSIEEEFAKAQILLRCHRSYLVNPINIDHVNKTNNRVELDINGEAIPVSKNYVSRFIA